jgi:predicted dehydrogenase
VRAVVIGVGHYHATYAPFYLDLLRKHGVEIPAVHDPDTAVAEATAARIGSAAYADMRAMLAEVRPDFILGLGRHVDMPASVEAAIESGIPAIMEKPWGIDPETVAALALRAGAAGAWIATPFSMRHSLWAQRCREMVHAADAMGGVSNLRFRMVRPGVQRYIDQGCPWMLSKAEAGGGVLLNLGIHGMDLCRWITGEEPLVVSAHVSNAVFGLDIEDYAHITLQTPSGVLFHVEVGYTYPQDGGADDERVFYSGSKPGATEQGRFGGGVMLREVPDGLEVVTRDGIETVPTPRDMLTSWEGVVVDCIERIRQGAPPPNTPSDLSRAVSLVFEAYRIAGV